MAQNSEQDKTMDNKELWRDNMKFRQCAKRIISIFMCLVMLFTSAPELWSTGVAAVVEIVSKAADETAITMEVPDGVEDATITANLTLTENTAYRNLEITGGTSP